MYNNIGGKIKGLAQTMFIFEAIGAIITGVVLMATGEDLTLYGFLTLVCGPIVAYVGSLILYAFGELVEDIHAMRNKYYPIEEEQKAQAFTCPNCQRKVYYGDVSCGSCGQQFDWSKM